MTSLINAHYNDDGTLDQIDAVCANVVLEQMDDDEWSLIIECGKEQARVFLCTLRRAHIKATVEMEAPCDKGERWELS